MFKHICLLLSVLVFLSSVVVTITSAAQQDFSGLYVTDSTDGSCQFGNRMANNQCACPADGSKPSEPVPYWHNPHIVFDSSSSSLLSSSLLVKKERSERRPNKYGYVDNLYFCNSNEPTSAFGGAFQLNDKQECSVKNSYTGDCTCPTSSPLHRYEAVSITAALKWKAKKDSMINVCIGKIVPPNTLNSTQIFGGMYFQIVGPSGVLSCSKNPYTNGCSCPVGYNVATGTYLPQTTIAGREKTKQQGYASLCFKTCASPLAPKICDQGVGGAKCCGHSQTCCYGAEAFSTLCCASKSSCCVGTNGNQCCAAGYVCCGWKTSGFSIAKCCPGSNSTTACGEFDNCIL